MTDQKPTPITDAELDLWESAPGYWADEAMVRLIAEVRRLRMQREIWIATREH